MPIITQIVSKEDNNLQNIYFYQEGIFYKAYERSAFAFVIYCKAFKVKKRYYKCLNKEIVSIGFPSAGLDKYFPKEKIHKSEMGVEVALDNVIDIISYTKWKESIPITEDMVNKNPKIIELTPCKENLTNNGLSDAEVVMKIKTFPIESKTPLDCMLFLSEIKNTL